MINYGLKQEFFIEQYFRLGKVSPKGWRQNLTGCPHCNDGRSKNPRSHFIFTNDEIGWQCFNCGLKHRFSGNNINSLATFISKSSWKKIGSILFELKKEKIFPNSGLKQQEDLKTSLGDDVMALIDYKEVELPGVSLKLDMDISKISKRYREKFKDLRKKAKDYLNNQNLLDCTDFYICVEGEYSNRLIFPIKFDGVLISWAARALYPTKNKYLYPPSDEFHNDRSRIIYGLDKIFKAENVKQIFLTESITDAQNLNGMAVLSKNISKEQIEILKRFNFQNKKLVFVLDNDKLTKWDTDLKGGELGKLVLNQNQDNWVVSIPNFGSNIKDVSESIKSNGVLETYDKIMSSFVTDASNMEMKLKLKSKGLKRKF